MDDLALLKAYLDHNDQEAFAHLVRRHTPWLYSAARRQLGDGQLAEDATQAVFLLLSQRANTLQRYRYLTGWLFLALSYCIRDIKAQRSRRQRREQEAAAMRPENAEPEIEWETIAPMLEAAVGQLGRKDRDAVLLRFYEQRPLAEVGSLLGISEDAARKRVNRALDTMRDYLATKGIQAQSLGLSTLILAHATGVAPAGLASQITLGVTQGIAHGAAVAVAKGAAKIMTLMKVKAAAIIVAGTVAIGAAGIAAEKSGPPSPEPRPVASQTTPPPPARPPVDPNHVPSPAERALEAKVRDLYGASRKAITSVQCDYTFTLNGSMTEVTKYRRDGERLYFAAAMMHPNGTISRADEASWDGQQAFWRVSPGRVILSSKRDDLHVFSESTESAICRLVDKALGFVQNRDDCSFLAARELQWDGHDCIELSWRIGALHLNLTAYHARDKGYWPVCVLLTDDQGRVVKQTSEIRYTQQQSAGRTLFYPVDVITRAEPDKPSNVLVWKVNESTLKFNGPIPLTQFQIEIWPCDVVWDKGRGPERRAANPNWSPVGHAKFPWDLWVEALAQIPKAEQPAPQASAAPAGSAGAARQPPAVAPPPAYETVIGWLLPVGCVLCVGAAGFWFRQRRRTA